MKLCVYETNSRGSLAQVQDVDNLSVRFRVTFSAFPHWFCSFLALYSILWYIKHVLYSLTVHWFYWWKTFTKTQVRWFWKNEHVHNNVTVKKQKKCTLTGSENQPPVVFTAILIAFPINWVIVYIISCCMSSFPCGDIYLITTRVFDKYFRAQ